MTRLLFFTFLLAVFVSPAAYAIKTIDITRGTIDPLPIAFPDTIGRSQEDIKMGEQLRAVVLADLERSGLFRAIDKSAYISNVRSQDEIPAFANWRQINATALVVGDVSVKGNEIAVIYRLWDVYGQQQISGRQYKTPRSDWRAVAHIIADDIFKNLTGEDGYFNTRIVYVSETGPATYRTKRLAIMDQDGANHRYLTDGSYLALTPRFAPSIQKIAYLSYAQNRPRVYMRDINNPRQSVLGDFPGMTFAPRFSPDGKKVIMSMARNGNTDIYLLDLRTRKKTRLTSNPAIDTSPSFSPDGKRVTFNSDRGGSQQLYVMDVDGRNVKRISFNKGRYGTPVWSPRGDWIAFTKMYKGKFHIGVMRVDGTGERILTESYMDEGPTWAPNGRVIIFTRQARGGRNTQGSSHLYSVDLTGYNLRKVPTPTDASDPAWSPLLQ